MIAEPSLTTDERPFPVLPPASARRLVVQWLYAFAAALVLYLLTAHRTEQWQDGGEQQVRILSGEIHHTHGLALIHPIQYWMGRLGVWLLPLEPAFCVTLISVIPSAAAVANVFALLGLLCERRVAATLGAASLALAHTFWFHATQTEVYGLVVLSLTTELLLLAWYARAADERALVGVAFFNGIGIANHLLNALVTPVHVAAVIAQIRRGYVRPHTLLLAIGVWIAGFMPYLILIVDEAQRIGVGAAIQSAVSGTYHKQVTSLQFTPRMLALTVGYVLYNFPGPALLLAAYAALRVPFQRRLHSVLLADGLILLIFAARYNVPDQFAFFFPFYVIVAIFFGLGLDAMLAAISPQAQRRALVLITVTTLWTPLIYFTTYAIAKDRGFLRGMVGNKPFRDGYASFFLPWNANESPERMTNLMAFGLAGERGLVVCADNMINFGLRYHLLRGRAGKDAELLSIDYKPTEEKRSAVAATMIAAHRARRTVVLVPRDRDNPIEIIPGAEWRRVADVYELIRIPQ